jgi:hypothetical protein
LACAAWLGLFAAGCLLQRQQALPLSQLTVRIANATVLCQLVITGTSWHVHLLFNQTWRWTTCIELTDRHHVHTALWAHLGAQEHSIAPFEAATYVGSAE